jgi:molybdenum cofactor cytidylyltransferase
MEKTEDAGVSLAGALRIERGDVVSFVGGGGKTTSMFRLARELGANGFRVVTATTTRIAEDQIQLSPAYITPEELATLGSCLDQFGQCLLAGQPDGKGSVLNIPVETIAGLKSRDDIDCILIESDGSKSRPFKAPAAHEPVVLGITTILVPVAGMNCLGKSLDDRFVHRPEIVASLAGCSLGVPVSPEIIARVLSHSEGGAKGLPPGARLVPLLNKVDTCDIKTVRETARSLMRRSNVDSVMIGSVDRDPPIREIWTCRQV